MADRKFFMSLPSAPKMICWSRSSPVMDVRLIAVGGALLWVSGLLWGCAASPQPHTGEVPDWITATPREDRYFYGLGISGRTRKTADAWRQATLRARAEKILQDLR